ncbi:ATP-dependent DNA helicase PIF1 [Symbiodinium microadriaticum]|uniref:ATP-dependent DNA helicase n=2 Tax=Symbiodinium TaxID=2949 RepID=A0A1Q9DVH0_SYMMI|nr:ATP-dependent DNA helicase PIF1 [Symbiodinium microadriaticum]
MGARGPRRKPRAKPRAASKFRRGRRRIRHMQSFLLSGEKAGPDIQNIDAEPDDPEAERISESQLTAEQRAAASRALAGENLFLTGPAGTGKSFLLRFLVQEFSHRHPGQVAVTASTGIAAAHLGGQTIHSFAGVGVGTAPLAKTLQQVQRSSAAVQRWKSTKVLVIDEISMIDGELLELLCGVARAVRKQSAPFGGLQVLFCGDFLQLPPVQERGKLARKFCFASSAWKKAGLHEGTVLLCQTVRQASDVQFGKVLNELRIGHVSDEAREMLAKCHVGVKSQPKDGILPTKLYCLNKNVDAENAARLRQLPGAPQILRAHDLCPRNTTPAQMALLDKKVPAELHLKVGAQVLHLKNEPNLGLVNGSRGIVEAFQDGKPVVRFDNGKTACAPKSRSISRLWEHVVVESFVGYLRFQVPLKLGWALTVHKAQGMTLTRAELQMDDAFEAGQSYVALSRLTGTSGLWIRGASATNGVRAHEEVLRYYEAAEKKLHTREVLRAECAQPSAAKERDGPGRPPKQATPSKSEHVAVAQTATARDTENEDKEQKDVN